MQIWSMPFSGITQRSDRRISFKAFYLIRFFHPPSAEIVLGAQVISVRGLMANCWSMAQAYAQARVRWEL